MGRLLWTIVKDGLTALAFWFVASLVMIYLWGYAGRMLSLGLGLIFIVSFIGVTLKRIVSSLPFSWARPGGGMPAPDPIAPGQANTAGTTCLTCSGSGRTNCSSCNGSGRTYHDATCPLCAGLRSFTCSTCLGRGVVYPKISLF